MVVRRIGRQKKRTRCSMAALSAAQAIKLHYVSGVLTLMDWIDPCDLLGLLDRLDIEIDYDGFVVASVRFEITIKDDGEHRIRVSLSKRKTRKSCTRHGPHSRGYPLARCVWEGYKGMKDPGLVELVLNAVVEAEFFYAAFPEATRRDVEKALRVSNAFEQLLDAAQT
jgi:hypothetical protein